MSNYQISLNDPDDLIDNPSPRCSCMLVLDTSGSMAGSPIAELNAGVQTFIKSVKDDDLASYSVELGVITAGGVVVEVSPFTAVSGIQGFKTLIATGTTPLGEAVELALQRIETRKNEYKQAGISYYKPWLVIISDGAPTDRWQEAARKAKDLSESRRLVSLPVGVKQADMAILEQFSHRGAKKMSGLKFRELFNWLSASMARVSASNSTSDLVTLPKTDSWDSI
jgi:uncharacterized protein YegL